MQGKTIHTLQDWMSQRPLAQEFHAQNMAALEQLDRNWPRLRSEKDIQWHTQPLPEHPQMEYHPVFDHKDRLVSLRETCVIVEPPGAHLLKRLTPPVLQRPLPSLDLVPSPRSVDWFIRDSGKIGRHFTRRVGGRERIQLVHRRAPAGHRHPITRQAWSPTNRHARPDSSWMRITGCRAVR